MKKIVVVAMLMSCTPLFAQQHSHNPKVHTVRPVVNTAEQKELDAILSELKQIRQLLADQNKYITQHTVAAPQQPQAPAIEHVSLKVEPGWEVMGSPDAPVTMVEFTDLQCPFCQRFHEQTFAQIKKDFIDTGKVRFVSRDMPLDFHPYSHPAAEAEHCAAEQGKFWEMRDTLISHAPKLQPDNILAYAGDLKLNLTAFKACVAANKYKNELDKDAAEAAKLGISGTPSFVIARTGKDELHGVKLVGALPYAQFAQYINDMLKPPTKTATNAAPKTAPATPPSPSGGQ